MSTIEARHERAWWGSFTLSEGDIGYWQVGPSNVWLERLGHEWRLHHQQVDDAMAERVTVAVPLPDPELPEDVKVTRFVVGEAGDLVQVQPRLADRAVVTRPQNPLYVMAGEEVTLYVSTPLWLRFAIGPDATLLTEIPSYRASDTWFGPSTLEGELCYATRTAARVRLADLPQPPHRAVTPLRLANRGGGNLLVERVRLPVEFLALYLDGDDRFWTQAATLVHQDQNEMSQLELGSGPPPEAGRADVVAEPRQQAEKGLLLRAVSRLFSGD